MLLKYCLCVGQGENGSESKQSKPKYRQKNIFCGTIIVIAIVLVLVSKHFLYEGPEGGYTYSFYISKM